MNRHVKQASWAHQSRMKMQSREELIKQKIAGLQTRALHSRENDCGAYSHIRVESNSFERWEAVAIEFRAGKRIGRPLLAPVSAALFEDSYGPIYDSNSCILQLI